MQTVAGDRRGRGRDQRRRRPPLGRLEAAASARCSAFNADAATVTVGCLEHSRHAPLLKPPGETGSSIVTVLARRATLSKPPLAVRVRGAATNLPEPVGVGEGESPSQDGRAAVKGFGVATRTPHRGALARGDGDSGVKAAAEARRAAKMIERMVR